eukprot:15431680-Alexandrium_andersonii.AAC.1
MHMRAPKVPRETRRLGHPASKLAGSDCRQFPNRGDGCLAHRARWDRSVLELDSQVDSPALARGSGGH